MVHITSAFKFLVAAAVASSCMAQTPTVAGVRADIAAVLNDGKDFESSLKEFPGSNSSWFGSASDLFSKINSINKAIDATAENIKNLAPLSTEDGQNLMESFAPVSTIIPGTLKIVNAKKAQFAAVPLFGDHVVAAVGQKLVAFKKSVDNCAAVVVGALPASQMLAAHPIQMALDASFAAALETYDANTCN